MKLTIKLSGIARDLSGKEDLIIELEHPDELVQTIIKFIPDLEKYYFLIAINGKKAENYSLITAEDTILVFSPVAGG